MKMTSEQLKAQITEVVLPLIKDTVGTQVKDCVAEAINQSLKTPKTESPSDAMLKAAQGGDDGHRRIAH